MTYFLNDTDKEYLLHPVKGETTRQTVERNYNRFVEPQPQIDYAKLAQSMEGMFQFDKNSIPPRQTGYGIQDDKNYAFEAPRQTYTPTEQQSQRAHSNWDGVATAAVTGFLDGVFGGAERLANGLTTGMYGYAVDQFLNNAYTNRQDRLQNQANYAGVGLVNNLSKRLIDGSALAMRYLLKK